jgi:hypothetical protein
MCGSQIKAGTHIPLALSRRMCGICGMFAHHGCTQPQLTKLHCSYRPQVAAMDIYAMLSAVHPRAVPASTLVAMIMHALDQEPTATAADGAADEDDASMNVVFDGMDILYKHSADLQQDVQSAIELAIRVLQYNGESPRLFAWLPWCMRVPPRARATHRPALHAFLCQAVRLRCSCS